MSIKKFRGKKIGPCVMKVYPPQKPQNLRNSEKMPILPNLYINTYFNVYFNIVLTLAI